MEARCWGLLLHFATPASSTLAILPVSQFSSPAFSVDPLKSAAQLSMRCELASEEHRGIRSDSVIGLYHRLVDYRGIKSDSVIGLYIVGFLNTAVYS